MNSRSTHDRRRTDEPVRDDRQPVGVWPSRHADHDAVELLGADGTVTRVVQLPDGSIEIRTEGLSAHGRSVRVPPTGPSRVVDC